MDWFESLTTLETVFFVFAALGGFLFVIQLVLMLIGIDGSDLDTGTDGALDTDLDMGSGGADASGAEVESSHADSDAGFKLLSFQGLTAFFMMFGLTGLAMSKGSGFGTGPSIGVGLIVGFAADLLVALLFRFFHRMESSGTMDLKNAIGQEGRVYLGIRGDEPGKVQISVQQHLKVFDAVSEDGSEIPTDTRVRVVRVVNTNTMVVKRV